jgi:transposase
LLIGLAQRLQLPEVLDRHLGNHGHHQGLSNGTLATVWLVFILAAGDHRKSTVQDWAERHRETLQRLLGQAIRAVEFDDDRLGIVLRRLSQSRSWEALETELWSQLVSVYALQPTGVRLDATSSYGYHTVSEEGVMQYGVSKDHRADLPQVKRMVASCEGTGQLLACDVLPRQCADDPCYLPLIARVRHMLARSGVLYAGDCKMAALATRAEIAAHQDYYLTALPLLATTQAEWGPWIEEAVAGQRPVLDLFWQTGAGEQWLRLLGGGYERQHALSATVEGQWVEWRERVLVLHSLEWARQQEQQLEQHLQQATAKLWTLTPAPGRGKRPYHDEAALQTAIAQVLQTDQVSQLLRVSWERQETAHTHYVGRGRGGPQRATRTDVCVRYVITAVCRETEAIAQHRARLGWRVLVSNAPVELLSSSHMIQHYRAGWSLERDFHLLKDRPLGISPLFVRKDDQIKGLTRLLTLGLRLLILIETQVRQKLAQTHASLVGLYPGQESRSTACPTATRLLQAFERAEITLTHVQQSDYEFWHITPLSPQLQRILAYLNLSQTLYEGLAQNSS